MTQFAKRIDIMEGEVKNLKVLTDSLVAPDLVSFAAGAPALEAYPFEKIREIAQDVFQEGPLGYAALKYGSTLGNDELRQLIKEIMLVPSGVDVDINNIMMTTGGIQPMSMIASLFIEPGDRVLVETPSFVQTSMIFKQYEAQLVPCKTDDDGIDPEDVEAKIKEYSPKLIYVNPTFQNPTGKTISLEKRKRLAEIVSKYDVILVEDDPYRQVRYSGEELPFIKAFDKTGNVILVNSFSKIFSPGARLGYMVANDEIMDKCKNIKLGVDTCTNGISQVLALEFLKRGYYPDHIKMINDMYRIRRDAMLKALDESFPAGTKHTNPDGGFYVWVELPAPLNATALKGEIAEKLHICYGDGSIFFTEGNPEGAGCNTMRMNFSGLTAEVIDTNLRKLGAFFCEKMN